MLVDILRMPPVFGVPISRELVIYSGDTIPLLAAGNFVHWPSVPFHSLALSAGATITETPENVRKAVYVSHDGHWVFEAVFSIKGFGGVETGPNLCSCLYVKCISAHGTHVGISLHAIDTYQRDKFDISPLSNFLAIRNNDPHHAYALALHNDSEGSSFILPPVYGQMELLRYVQNEWSAKENGTVATQSRANYKVIDMYEPALFTALVEGEFHRIPYHQVPTFHPSVNLRREKDFRFEELRTWNSQRGFDTRVNEPEFDSLVSQIIHMRPGSFSITANISHVIDAISELWVVEDYHDPYVDLLPEVVHPGRQFKDVLSGIMYEALMIYCRMFSIDCHQYAQAYIPLSRYTDSTSLTVTKNIYDEVTFVFQDTMFEHFVVFYHSFPAIALATQSVGCRYD